MCKTKIKAKKNGERGVDDDDVVFIRISRKLFFTSHTGIHTVLGAQIILIFQRWLPGRSVRTGNDLAIPRKQKQILETYAHM